MKVLLDMNLSMAWLPVLRAGGHDAMHWLDCGDSKAADIAIMAYARDHGFVILTHDLDFGTLLSLSGGTAPSIIQLRSGDLTPRAAKDIVLRTLLLAGSDLDQGAIATVDVARVRLRILPILGRNSE